MSRVVWGSASGDAVMERLPDGVRLHTTDGGTVQVEVASDRILHVTAQPPGAPALQPSYVVIHKWKAVPFQVDESKPAWITLSTAKLRVRMDRATGAVSFFDLNQVPVLAEQSRQFTPAVVNKEKTWTVEQTFHCAPDESLYGMGQFQDGHWDWRGLPLQLRQVNTEIAAPMLVSPKGYGILWDNASLTDFNPVDDNIPLTSAVPAETVTTNAPAVTATQGKAPPPQKEDTHAVRTGSFTTGDAGEYVFFAKDGNRRNEFTILVDDKPVISLQNIWLPYSISGTAWLPAHTTVKVALRGGGPHAQLGARPLRADCTTFRSQVGNGVDYWFFYGPKMEDVIAGYREATGAAPLWPKWAYGFWQCRERYSSQKQILDTMTEFRKRQIPVDLIIQDWHYWGKYGWGAYQMDEANYPDPAAMISQLHRLNSKFMIVIWPNPSGPVHDALQEINGLLTGGPNGVYDATNPTARQIRWQYVKKAFFDIGVDAWWQDADEPMDDGNAMNGKQTFLGSGNRYRNAYPLFHNEGVYEGQRAASPSKRVVILSRSAYLGQQRYGAAAWSGDINGTWDSFRRQIPAGLNYCLTGQPLWTTDCGGFFRPDGQYQSVDYNELQTRWFQWSTFCPILRIHGYRTETEIWKWLPETQANLLAYDQFRYRMLPYIYSVAWEVTTQGSTMMRALPLDFQADAKACAIPDEYMFGPAFLVSPVDQPQATSRRVYLPRGADWIDFWTGTSMKGGQEIEAAAPLSQIPLFVRMGSIVPLGPALQYADEKPADPIELRIYRGADGAFTLYEDEGDSYNYEKGAFAEIPINWSEARQTLTIGNRKGNFPGMLAGRTFHIVWVSKGHGTGMKDTVNPDAEVHYDGRAISVRAEVSSSQ